MAGSGTTSNVPGSAYDFYNTAEVLEMMELDEHMMEGSDDDLELDMGSGEHER